MIMGRAWFQSTWPNIKTQTVQIRQINRYL
ncbi:hypothetical protein NC653_035242 [Populus alba x Populus x berolinensis]|uniref:Uncharacterized protein n=1 Tax=Populus alba x Populus x berolinensis TaxID=444605 RepID=A0AAD6LPE9_9ROSI|nr:hypothetical protein NC653_035242 [Populus alba x Populus x berolinensis]